MISTKRSKSSSVSMLSRVAYLSILSKLIGAGEPNAVTLRPRLSVINAVKMPSRSGATIGRSSSTRYSLPVRFCRFSRRSACSAFFISHSRTRLSFLSRRQPLPYGSCLRFARLQTLPRACLSIAGHVAFSTLIPSCLRHLRRQLAGRP